jgi:hypothetical protein
MFFLEFFLPNLKALLARHFGPYHSDKNILNLRTIKISTSASFKGDIIVFLEYDPVKKESKTIKSFSTTSLTLFCRVETVDFCKPVISRFSFSFWNADSICCCHNLIT